jgi:hypothetical protein
VVEQIANPRNFIVNLGFVSVDNEFLGVTICSTTLSAMCYLYSGVFTYREQAHAFSILPASTIQVCIMFRGHVTQALVSFIKYMPPPLPYFKVNIYPFPLPHFASIFFAYLWSFRWPNYIVTLPRYFSFRLPHLNIATGPPSDELDKKSQRTWLIKNFSQWNGYNHFRSGLNWSRKF